LFTTYYWLVLIWLGRNYTSDVWLKLQFTANPNLSNRTYKIFRYGYVVDFADIQNLTNQSRLFQWIAVELGDEMEHYSNTSNHKKKSILRLPKSSVVSFWRWMRRFSPNKLRKSMIARNIKINSRVE
jgi:hypothetical protein